MYTVNANKPMYDAYSTVFDQMKRDRPMKHPFRSATVRGSYGINFYPQYDTTAANDPIMKRLDKVRCTGASGATGIGDRTLIRISMYGWNGVRGRYLADKVAAAVPPRLRRAGDPQRRRRVRRRQLRASGVTVRTASYDRNDNGTVDMYTHQKYMILSGSFGNRAGWHVWTGSQNWSDIALNGDEVTMHIPRRGAFYEYRKNFDYLGRPTPTAPADPSTTLTGACGCRGPDPALVVGVRQPQAPGHGVSRNHKRRVSARRSDDGEREQLLAGRADLDLGVHLRADAAVVAGRPAAVLDLDRVGSTASCQSSQSQSLSRPESRWSQGSTSA